MSYLWNPLCIPRHVVWKKSVCTYVNLPQQAGFVCDMTQFRLKKKKIRAKSSQRWIQRKKQQQKPVPFYEGFLCTLNWYNSCRHRCCSDKAANLLSAGINEAALFPRRAACPLAPRCDRTTAFKNAAADRGTHKPRQDLARIARVHDVQSEFRRAGESY